mmetsp:Transcript_25426/g.45934  ORF Transcript_25426/g.45934 Transcript_25426/m.45934 type:complete len:86 (-) Transcript_25426:1123-1380(-)
MNISNGVSSTTKIKLIDFQREALRFDENVRGTGSALILPLHEFVRLRSTPFPLLPIPLLRLHFSDGLLPSLPQPHQGVEFLVLLP